jgi:hypothetical protein
VFGIYLKFSYTDGFFFVVAKYFVQMFTAPPPPPPTHVRSKTEFLVKYVMAN